LVRAQLSFFTIAAVLSACATSPSNLSDTEQEGEQLFSQACASCHSTISGVTLVGPSLAGIANSAEGRAAGLSAHDYLLQSIVEPSAYVNEGFQNIMPQTFGDIFTDEQLEALVAFLLTLK
jgi:mono/diheme cytochrome c family protein